MPEKPQVARNAQEPKVLPDVFSAVPNTVNVVIVSARTRAGDKRMSGISQGNANRLRNEHK
jgi:hypothetical protein